MKKYFPNAKQAHGPEFRKLMNLIGLPGKTYHSLEKLGGKTKKTQETFEYKCKCRVHNLSKIIHNKVSKGLSYRCRTCGERIVKA